jgi:hypothetical protein
MILTTALPVPANTTCDIYHNGNAPPAAPDVAQVGCCLEEQYSNIKPVQQGLNYTHIVRVPTATDVRDNYGGGAGADVVYVPGKTGTAFTVIAVARSGRGTALDHKIVYLNRNQVTWPSNDV